MIETHPFGTFAPPGSTYLILGSFAGKEAADGTQPSYDWFYALKRNQFWPIMQAVYGRDLTSKQSKQELLTDLGMAIADIIYQCERNGHSNLDKNLANIVYATEPIAALLANNPIRKIFFTSRFTMTRFRSAFREIISRYPQIELVPLPSPSPRYALMSREEKIAAYKRLLPRLPASE